MMPGLLGAKVGGCGDLMPKDGALLQAWHHGPCGTILVKDVELAWTFFFFFSLTIDDTAVTFTHPKSPWEGGGRTCLLSLWQLTSNIATLCLRECVEV